MAHAEEVIQAFAETLHKLGRRVSVENHAKKPPPAGAIANAGTRGKFFTRFIAPVSFKRNSGEVISSCTIPFNDRQTTVPLHAGDVPRRLLRQINQQAGRTEKEFRALR